jgi:hypothetical protein
MTASLLTTSVWGPGDPGAARARIDRQKAVRTRLDRERAKATRKGQAVEQQPR